jgi:GT2 family glycosyltransferase
MLDKILFSVVLYNKSISDLPLLKSLAGSGAKIDLFVYDNSRLAQKVPGLQNANIYYEHDEKNSGVSRAYNQAYKKAKALNKSLLLVLDQDSAFEIGFLHAYMQMYRKYGQAYLYAPIVTNPSSTKIYSPALLRHFVGKTRDAEQFTYEETYSLNGKSVINSGLMIPLRIFEEIGGYNEALKLDFSDVYFIEKYKNTHPKIVLVNIRLKHSISGDEAKDFDKEHHRFKHYCSASRELERSLKTRVLWSPLRRALRLTQKYKSLKFIKTLYAYYIKGKTI